MRRRQVKALCAAVSIAVAALMLVIVWPGPWHEPEPVLRARPFDAPIVDYSQYKLLMRGHPVVVERGGTTVVLDKREMDWHDLQIIGLALRAE